MGRPDTFTVLAALAAVTSRLGLAGTINSTFNEPWTPQFTGSPGQVADQLEQLQEATGADELIIITITHDHADWVRSYRLLAVEWQCRRRS
jgi:alkanesulfonate monooxygenase SsuD/methylene tetrahydromethanopterin reductase-like flavin-dependent oxidoreductase (luciferase family)